LTIVVPDNSALLPTDEIIATWTGAQGTPAGGSHTSAPRPLGSNREFAIPNSVVAFNLNKDVKVSYVVIRDGKPLPSLVFDLTVLSMPQNELLKPIIKDADNDGEGPEFNVGNLTSNATYRMGVWPLIATGQYVWLRLKGTNADGSDYNLQIHTAPGSYVTDQWIAQGYYERSIALEGLKNLKDGSPLTMEFKAAFGKNTNESEAVDFPVRTYMIKALEDVRPEITGSKDSKGNEILPGGTTVDTSITLEGTGAKGQEVEIFDGATSTGKKPKADDKGIWTVELTGLTTTTHLFKAKALYGGSTESEVWTVTVADLVDLVEDFRSYPIGIVTNPGQVIEGTHTSVTLITDIGKGQHLTFVSPEPPYAILNCVSNLNKFEFSIALKKGRSKGATIRGRFDLRAPTRIGLEFMLNNDVVSSITFQEGTDKIVFEREVAPSSGQAFNAIKFVMTPIISNTDEISILHIATIAFKG
jgi:hypothetical protein